MSAIKRKLQAQKCIFFSFKSYFFLFLQYKTKLKKNNVKL